MGFFLSKLALLTIAMSIAGLPKAYSIELPADNWNLNIFSYVNSHLAHSGGSPCVRLVVTLFKSSFIEQRAREE